MTPKTTRSGQPILSVTALNSKIKDTLDEAQNLRSVYIVGETSNIPRNRSPFKTQLFDVKDDHSAIPCVIFKNVFQRIRQGLSELGVAFDNGEKFLLKGTVSSFVPFGRYQLTVWDMKPLGLGNLYQKLRITQSKLRKEGLFNPELKKQLPTFPKRIAVITSPSGAVIRDIIVTARRRYKLVRIVLYPAKVQGQGSSESVIEQLHNIEHDSHGAQSYDDVILGRGGGSLEDLWGFETAGLAHAIYECPIPIISSVGHETDNTTADLVADKRAATPTAAAELATPVRLQDVEDNITDFQNRIQQAMANQIHVDQQQLNQMEQSYVFTDPQKLYQPYVQQLTDLQRSLHDLSKSYISNAQNKITLYKQRVVTDFKSLLQAKRMSMQKLVGTLDQLSPLKVMSHGYSMITKHGHIIKHAKDLKPNDKIHLRLADGQRNAKIIKETRTIKPTVKATNGQQSLFR